MKPGSAASSSPGPERRQRLADRADRYRLYQLAVQNPEFELDFMARTFHDLRGRAPLSMREDFCGTALSCCEWVKRGEEHSALGLDIDKEPLQWAADQLLPALSGGQRLRLRLLPLNVLEAPLAEPVDFIQALNFSYWILLERPTMKEYFSRARQCLEEDGILFLDACGGKEMHCIQQEKRALEDAEIGKFSYIWDQAQYNAVTYEMQCHIHFRFPDRSKIEPAFSYHWRLWGAREIRELLAEVGFRQTLIYRQMFDEQGQATDRYEATEEAGDYATWIAYIVALK